MHKNVIRTFSSKTIIKLFYTYLTTCCYGNYIYIEREFVVTVKILRQVHV